MKTRLFLIFVASLLAACGGGHMPSPQATCGPPPPVPEPFLALAYPEPNATSVPTSVGILVFAGYPGALKISMQSAGGGAIPIGAPTAAPSPMPTPFATPANFGGDVPYFSAPIPTLSPATTYSLSYTYTDYTGIPPACVGPVTQQLGAFTTK